MTKDIVVTIIHRDSRCHEDMIRLRSRENRPGELGSDRLGSMSVVERVERTTLSDLQPDQLRVLIATASHGAQKLPASAGASASSAS